MIELKKILPRHMLVMTAVAISGLSFGQGNASDIVSPVAPVMVSNVGYRLLIDSKKGGIVSLRSTFGSERNLLVPNHIDLPLFRLELMDDHSKFRTINSSQAKKITIQETGDGKGQTVTIEFKSLDNMPI